MPGTHRYIPVLIVKPVVTPIRIALFSYHRKFDTEHPAVVLLGFNLTRCNQLDKGFVRWTLLPLGLLQRCDIYW